MVKTKGAKTIRWDDVRADVQRMYVGEGLKLQDVRSRLKRKKGFDASIRSYRSKINEWGFKRRRTPRSTTQQALPNHDTSTSNDSDELVTLTRSSSTVSAHSTGLMMDHSTARQRALDTLVSTFGSSPNYSPPAASHDPPDEYLLELLDHIEKGRVSELRLAMTVEDPSAAINRIIPCMIKYPALSRFLDQVSGKPMLYWAAAKLSAEAVETLLLAGADID